MGMGQLLALCLLMGPSSSYLDALSGLDAMVCFWFNCSIICSVWLMHLRGLFFSKDRQSRYLVWILGRKEIGRTLGEVGGGETAVRM